MMDSNAPCRELAGRSAIGRLGSAIERLVEIVGEVSEKVSFVSDTSPRPKDSNKGTPCRPPAAVQLVGELDKLTDTVEAQCERLRDIKSGIEI